ncbi:hypothetical protein HOLleu_26824 [Holothuria leucospilota]|uniref:Uncharacterized protein n=1 Tax=Holothuria leucospilota TaxID=206669 RepID=A0A9Q1H297_HOLLE|nr:hypothetical protein HOLleu_26824 [Holothuria leucospilota]
MCGDFNFVFDLNLDKMGGQQRTNFRARGDCLRLMATYNLVDIWRERHPMTKSFTWSSNILLGLHCRLDLFLISHHLSHVVNNLSQPLAIQSDHSMIFISCEMSSEKRGPGYWKLNNSFLNDSNYIDLITKLIVDTSEIQNVEDPSSLWEFLKFKIRKVSINYSKCKAGERRSRENSLTEKIAILERNLFNLEFPETRAQLLEARNELLLYYDQKLQGTIIRSRARWVEQGEKNTSYFLNLEKCNKSNNTIYKIKDSEGNDYVDSKIILNEIKCFYEKLY